MFKVGLSTASKIVNEDLFIQYEKAGISMMEISLKEPVLNNLDFEQVKKWADAHNVELWSLHFPFNPDGRADIAAHEDTVREATIEYYTELIKKGTDIGIKTFVIHPCSVEPIEEDERRDIRMKYSKECLNTIAEIAHDYDAVIAVENLPRSCLARNSKELLELLDSNDKLRVCYDTNHLLEQDSLEFIKAVGNKIITLHVSDYDFINERHWLPGEGSLNWQEIIKSLKEFGYNGPWMYEIDFECPVTILRDRNLNCKDFALNAKELFENKQITVCSKPKPNLGMWE